MRNDIENEKLYFDAFSNLFIAINKLCTFYKFEQAIEVMNLYFSTNDAKVLTTQNGIREFVVSNNIRNILYPVIIENSDNLYEYFDLLVNGKRKNNSM